MGVIVGDLGTERLEDMHPIMMRIAIVMVKVTKKETPWERATMDEWAGPVVFLPMPSSKMRQPEGAQGLSWSGWQNRLADAAEIYLTLSNPG